MQSSRTSKYNLDDDRVGTFGEDTELTHGGVSIDNSNLKFTVKIIQGYAFRCLYKVIYMMARIFFITANRETVTGGQR